VTTITKYAIKHVPTGHFLPEPTGRAGRGGSHLEPADPKTHHPRLCHTERQAKIVLTVWLQGKVYCDRGGDIYDGFYEETRLTPVPSRKREDMEIVPVTVTFPN
jgi:hypothetical protein